MISQSLRDQANSAQCELPSQRSFVCLPVIHAIYFLIADLVRRREGNCFPADMVWFLSTCNKTFDANSPVLNVSECRKECGSGLHQLDSEYANNLELQKLIVDDHRR